MLKSKAPERPGSKEIPKRDIWISLGRRNRGDLFSKLGAGWSGSEHGKSGWLFECV